MKFKHLNILFFLLAFAAYSCSNNEDQPAEPPLHPDLGKSYFFLESGKYREYDVYRIRYTAVDISDTTTYQIREEIRESIENLQAEKAHLVYRYSRIDETQDWKLDSVWSARVERTFAVSTENNEQFVKMAYPSDTLQTWDRNLYNGRDEEIAQMKTFNEPFTIGFNTFLKASEILIRQEDDSITFRDNRFEVFSDSIGLVYKYSEVLKYCSDQDRCEIGAKIIESGRYYTETLVAHGNINEDQGN